MMRQTILLAAVAAVLGGCATVGPEYVRPKVVVPEGYRQGTPGWKKAEPRDHVARGKWWEVYGDARLNALAEKVESGNQNVAAAEARVRQALAIARQARADLYPAVSASGGASRSGASGANAGASNRYDVGVDAAWEPDLWGRVRRSIEAGEAQWQATAGDLAAVRLSATAALVQNYLSLRVVDAQARLLTDTVAAFNKSLELTRNRYAVGVAGRQDVVLAEAQVKGVQAQLVDLGVLRAQLEHAIAVLVGEPPAAITIEAQAAAPGLPDIPAALPSELLERRPDIAAAERRMAAASARIGVAESAFYPSVSLAGSVGLRSALLGDLISAPSTLWSLGAAAAQLLVDGGARQSAVEQTRAAFDAEVAAYRQAVLTGFQEVEDNLAALRILAEQAKLQEDATKASRTSVELMLNRYRAGTVGFLDVISVQTILLSNERALLAILGRRLAASALLVKALGGGWDAASLEAMRIPRTLSGAGK
jgi:NodT family efflux transporter outer membrane factor (OMF) lipoprotein